MRFSCLRLVFLSAPLLLTACGDGWEVHRTTEVFPYGNQRTAGSGVVYVRAKMLPEKELVVEEKITEKATPSEKIVSGEQVFAEAQKKGSSIGAPPPPENKESGAHNEEARSEPKKEETKESHEKAAVAPAAGKINEDVKPTTSSIGAIKSLKSAEPLEQQMDKNEDDQPFVPDSVEPHAGNIEKESSLMGIPGSSSANTASLDIVEIPEEVSLNGENRSVMPVKEIKSPKMDYLKAEYEGQRSLEEIYSNPF